MNKWIVVAALAILAAAPVQARSHHPRKHHHPAPAIAYPDSVMLEGKEYKVCKRGMQDDCVQPRDAGLGLGRTRRHR